MLPSQAPLHDAFVSWGTEPICQIPAHTFIQWGITLGLDGWKGYPFEKRKKTGFAAKANLVSDATSFLWSGAERVFEGLNGPHVR